MFLINGEVVLLFFFFFFLSLRPTKLSGKVTVMITLYTSDALDGNVGGGRRCGVTWQIFLSAAREARFLDGKCLRRLWSSLIQRHLSLPGDLSKSSKQKLRLAETRWTQCWWAFCSSWISWIWKALKILWTMQEMSKMMSQRFNGFSEFKFLNGFL